MWLKQKLKTPNTGYNSVYGRAYQRLWSYYRERQILRFINMHERAIKRHGG